MCIDAIKQIEDVLLYFEKKNERKGLQKVWILQKLMDLKWMLNSSFQQSVVWLQKKKSWREQWGPWTSVTREII
jgi:hypothetical protein